MDMASRAVAGASIQHDEWDAHRHKRSPYAVAIAEVPSGLAHHSLKRQRK